MKEESSEVTELVVQKKSQAWIFYAMIAGLSYGLGNTIFGLHIT